MANPILSSDLYKDDAAITTAIAQLKELETQYQSTLKSMGKDAIVLETKVKKLNGTTAEQREEIKETAKQTEEIKKRYDKYQESLGEASIKIAALKNAQTKLNQVHKLEAKLAAAKEGSYDALSAQYSLNKIRLNQMGDAERKATKEGKELVAQSAELYAEMKRLQEETGKHVLNVGNYADATKGLVAQLEEMPGALGSATQGVKAMGAQFKKLLRNPVVLVLAAIVGTLYALFNAFKSSAKGSELMAKGSAVLAALFSNLVELSVKLYDALIRAFNDPKKAILDFGKLLVDQVINRLKGAFDLVVALVTAIGASLTFNLKKLEEAAKAAGTALVQIGTGLDVDQQKEMAEAVKELAKEIAKETQAFIDLETQKYRVQVANRALIRSIEDLITKEEVYAGIADDATKSFKEREDAAEQARKALEARSKKEIQIARNNLSVINKELSLRKANGEKVSALLDEQLAAYQELKGAERSLTLAIQDNERTRAELKQDRLEKDLDILIDGFDNQKTINERLIQDEQKTFVERGKILEATKRLADDSFKKQIETIQQFTGIAIKANELISESDAVALNEKIRALGLSEIIEGRLLEIVRERRIATQDLAEAEIGLAEATRKAGLDKLKTEQELTEMEFEMVKRNEVEKGEFQLQAKREQLDRIKELNEQFKDVLPPIDTSKLELELEKLENVILSARRNLGIKLFDEQQQLDQSEFDLLKKTEKQKTQFRLQAEKERFQKILELNEKFGGDLSDKQVQTIKNQIAAIDAEFARISRPTDIYELFGFNVSDEQKQAVSDATAFAIEQVTAFATRRTEIANQNVANAQSDVDQAQRSLDAVIAAEARGEAVDRESAERQFSEAKARQKKALAEQKRAQKQQAAIESIQQASSLVTASAKIWAQLGFPAAIPSLAIMWGSFIASKARAAQLSKQQFGDGMFEHINYNGSHASGNDTDFGTAKNGRRRTVERDEVITVFPKKTVRKYGVSTIKNIYDSLKAGTFHDYMNNVSATATDVPIFNYSDSTDTTGIEDGLDRIYNQAKQKSYYTPDGKFIEQYGDVTTIHLNKHG